MSFEMEGGVLGQWVTPAAVPNFGHFSKVQNACRQGITDLQDIFASLCTSQHAVLGIKSLKRLNAAGFTMQDINQLMTKFKVSHTPAWWNISLFYQPLIQRQERQKNSAPATRGRRLLTISNTPSMGQVLPNTPPQCVFMEDTLPAVTIPLYSVPATQHPHLDPT